MKKLLGICLMLFVYLCCSHVNPRTYETTQPAQSITPEKKVEVTASQTTCIEIKIDERVQDFASRLEKSRLTTVQALSKAAAKIPFSSFSFYSLKKHAPSQPLLRLEGLLTPGMYEIPILPVKSSPASDVTAQEEYNARYIINHLLEAGSRRYSQLKASNGLTPYEQIILASIVEKEAVANQDYDLVASVFYNRLKYKVNLASCPVLEYALGYHRPFLIKADILFNSPFNLYRKVGLPPAPICFFSDAALAAVLQPAHTMYIFFVYDWVERKLLFAREYAKHLENVTLVRRHYSHKYGQLEMYKIYPDLYYESVDNENDKDKDKNNHKD